MTAADYDALRLSLIAHEGRRAFPYVDTAGKLTIGVGRNLTDVGLSEEEIDALLDHDIAKAENQVANALPWFKTLDGARQRVLIEMCFNLGISGLLEFHRTLADIRDGQYELAATAMLASRWAAQVGARAQRLATLMRTGAVNA